MPEMLSIFLMQFMIHIIFYSAGKIIKESKICNGQKNNCKYNIENICHSE